MCFSIIPLRPGHWYNTLFYNTNSYERWCFITGAVPAYLGGVLRSSTHCRLDHFQYSCENPLVKNDPSQVSVGLTLDIRVGLLVLIAK